LPYWFKSFILKHEIICVQVFGLRAKT